MPRRPGSGRLPGDRGGAGDQAAGPGRPSTWGRRSRVFLQTVANGLDQHVGNVGRPLVQVVDRSRLGRTQAGQRIAASQRRPAAENMPPHAAAGEKIARHGWRGALGDPLRGKRAAGIGRQIVVRYSLLRADHASQARMGNMNLPVVCDQDVLHADIAVDQSPASFQGDKFAEHRTGDFQDHLGRKTAVMEHEIGQRSALDPGRGGPVARAVQAACIDHPGWAGQAFSDGDQFFELCAAAHALSLWLGAGKHRQPDDFSRLPVFRPIDGRIATFMDRLTQNVARDLQCFTAPGVDLRRLKMGEDAGLAEGIDPNGLESRQIAGHAMDGGLDAFEVSLGRQSESRQAAR